MRVTVGDDEVIYVFDCPVSYHSVTRHYTACFRYEAKSLFNITGHHYQYFCFTYMNCYLLMGHILLRKYFLIQMARFN